MITKAKTTLAMPWTRTSSEGLKTTIAKVPKKIRRGSVLRTKASKSRLTVMRCLKILMVLLEERRS